MAERPSPKGVVPKGAFHFDVESFRETRRIGFLLMPDFTLLAFSSAVDPLRIANQLSQKPLYDWVVVSEDGVPVSSSSGVSVNVDIGLTDVPDRLQLMVCSGNDAIGTTTPDTLAALRRHVRFGGTVGGICTGAAVLAQAGLLADRKFTLHWENQPSFVEVYPDLIPTGRRFEVDGTLWTSGGGAAATEMMLAMIAQDYGRDFAVVVSDRCLNGGEFEPRSSQRSSIARALNTRNPRLIRVVQLMYEHIEEPLSMDELSERSGASRRQIERHFKSYIGQSPASVYRGIRLDRARSLLVETDMTASEIAVACGFNSLSNFARRYRERFGVSPSRKASD